MSKASGNKKLLVFGSILGFIVLMLAVLASGTHEFKTLPILGPKELILKDGVADTLYHTIPDFAFTDHRGTRYTSDSIEGKILVVDYFFTRCGTICPKMSREMKRLDWMLDDPKFDDVIFLSHTVDPAYDNPEILADYRKEYEASERWVFLTGDKQSLYEMGVKGYLISAQEDALAPGGFLHSEKFVLIDPKRRIRGYYDGTDGDDVRRLEEEIKLLMKEIKDERRG